MAQAIVLMGVSGSGKSTVGRALAAKLGCTFYDGDDYMPAAKVQKMASGTPLTDADRAPWLDLLQALLAEKLAAGQSLVLACSALKKSYRDRLRSGNPEVVFVHLKGDYELIQSRLAARPVHFMKAGMLQSQFDTLEEPQNAIVVEVTRSVDEIVAEIMKALPAQA